jgi:hypothetical protein
MHPFTAPNPVAREGDEESSLVMADDEVCALWCLIQGDPTTFKVITPGNVGVDNLKNLVQEVGINVTECNSILAKHITLWKVSILEASAIIAADTLCVVQ